MESLLYIIAERTAFNILEFGNPVIGRWEQWSHGVENGLHRRWGLPLASTVTEKVAATLRN